MTVTAAMSAVSSALQWPGGLSQTDWFGLASGSVGCAAAGVTYNQAAYVSNCAMRQAQIYQQKNYHISWVSIARDDIREMMNITVTRINNYMIVATLILGIAASLVTTPIPESSPLYMKLNFWLSLGIAIGFFALSIIFAVKGQNSAFLNTMRLLTWEMRPENPPSYTHDYMQQAQQFERDGLAQMFRIPGVMPRYRTREAEKRDIEAGNHERSTSPLPIWSGPLAHGSNGSAPRSSSVPPSAKYAKPAQQSLEELSPESHQLIYLKRYARYMALWQPYDTQTKHCIGIGLISLCHCTAYFCLGLLMSDDNSYTSVVGVMMVIVLNSIAWMVYHLNVSHHKWFAKISVWLLFAWGPTVSIICTLFANRVPVLATLFALLCPTGHGVLYLAYYIASFYGWHSWRSVEETTAEYTRGPDGQQFENLIGDDANDLCNLRHSSAGSSKSDCAPEHQAVAEKVRIQARSTVRNSILLAAIMWFLCAVVVLHAHVTATASLYDADPYWTNWTRRLERATNTQSPLMLSAQVVPVSWPSAMVGPRFLACAGGDAFTANAYQVFRVPVSGGAAVPEPCSGFVGARETIVDVAADCDAASCWPLVLLGGRSAGQVLDCASGHRQDLMRAPLPATKLTLMFGEDNGRELLGGNALAATAAGSVVELARAPGGGWRPLWEVVSDEGAELCALGAEDGHLFFFRGGGAVELLNATTGQPAGHWSVGTPIAAGCALGGGAVLTMPEGRAPDFLVAQLADA